VKLYEAKTWTRSAVVSRGEYVCCECDGRIVKGELYEKFEGLWPVPYDPLRFSAADRAKTFRSCSSCAALRLWLLQTFQTPIPFGTLHKLPLLVRMGELSCPVSEAPHDRFNGLASLEPGKWKNGKRKR
jgi:hypothetical protein